MGGLWVRWRLVVLGVVAAVAVTAVLVWAPHEVLVWGSGVAAAAMAAYLSQDVPRVVRESLASRKAHRELTTGVPINVTVRLRNLDYVVVDEGDRVVDVPASGHTVQLVVAGAAAHPVVLTDLRPEVVSRGDRSGDLSRHAAEVPLRRFEVLLDARPPTVRSLTSSDFPFRVAGDEVEVFDLVVSTESGDVRWVLWLDWSCRGRAGSTRIDLDGEPFRTVARHPREAAS